MLEVLQRRTLDAWQAELADLRVRPFTDQATSLRVAGILGRGASPLEALFREVWREVGGTDRGRSFSNGLRIAAVFSPMIQFVEDGRMATIAELFGALYVALEGLDDDADVGQRRLMDVQARGRSIAALNQAPRLVVQVIEDVLAQTAATQQALLQPRAALAWQSAFAGACRYALSDRYPFVAGAGDADLRAVADLLGPDGVIARFLATQLAPILDMSEAPWRWLPEARLAGFSPDSAAFFERAATIGDALFPADGSPVALTLTALAQPVGQRDPARVSLGGASVPIITSGDPGELAWPGPSPDQGFGVAFAADAERAWPGAWGLLKFLDERRIRARDGGQRYRFDVRVADSSVYLDLAFDRAANPVAVRGLLSGLACPPTL